MTISRFYQSLCRCGHGPLVHFNSCYVKGCRCKEYRKRDPDSPAANIKNMDTAYSKQYEKDHGHS